jgi:hypothetical protein
MNKNQLEKLIKETLQEVQLYTPEALQLLLGTAAQESHLGEYIEQIHGPAKGVFQMEPATYTDIWRNYLHYKPVLKDKVLNFCVTGDNADEMRWNLKLAIVMARVHYLRDREAIPFNLVEQSKYYKRVYNTIYGKATPEEYVKNYLRFVK